MYVVQVGEWESDGNSRATHPAAEGGGGKRARPGPPSRLADANDK